VNFLRVRNWERFQHYKGRTPKWIRVYVDTLDNPEVSRLTDAQFGQLVRIWLLAARSDNKLPNDPGWIRSRASLSRAPLLSILCQAGQLEAWEIATQSPANDDTGSSPLGQNATPDRETETEGELDKGSSVVSLAAEKAKRRHPTESALEAARSLVEILRDKDEWTEATISRFCADLPPAAFYSVREKIEIDRKQIRSDAAYAYGALSKMVSEGQYSARRSA
jgi:hypothetical protein